MGIQIVEKIDNFVKINQVLISVSDKAGLEEFVQGLVEINPQVRILSTGGTHKKIQDILGEKSGTLLRMVSDYTGQPETEGGLVKTLDFKIYLGLLTETYNPSHQEDLKRTLSRPIDMVVVNLYPFEETVAQKDISIEKARGNIDIGGPCMIRAAAKNFLRVASVVSPKDYPMILSHLRENQGKCNLPFRFALSKKAFAHTAEYDLAISRYLADQAEERLNGMYTMNNS